MFRPMRNPCYDSLYAYAHVKSHLMLMPKVSGSFHLKSLGSSAKPWLPILPPQLKSFSLSSTHHLSPIL